MTITDIINKVYLLTNTNSTSLSSANALLLVNNAYERVASVIMKADGRWQWDDNNNTSDFPIATTDLVSGQADYTLTVDHLEILRVELSNPGGTFTLLTPFDQVDKQTSLTQLGTETGTPTQYDKLGASVILYPKPNYNYTAGLKIYFQRGPSLFSSADVSTGTKKPGFSSLYHDLIPLWASYDYAVAKGMNNINQLYSEIVKKEDALKLDYSMRSKDEKIKLSIAQENNR